MAFLLMFYVWGSCNSRGYYRKAMLSGEVTLSSRKASYPPNVAMQMHAAALTFNLFFCSKSSSLHMCGSED